MAAFHRFIVEVECLIPLISAMSTPPKQATL
jgi:hypothetical protein